MHFQKIKQKIKASHSVDFGTVFNQSIELFKETWAQGLIMMVLLFVSILVIEFIIIAPLIGLVSASGSLNDINLQEFSFLLFLLVFVLVFLFFAAIITLVNGLLGGLYIVYKKADHNEFYSTNDLFTLLKGDKIFKTFKVSLLQMLITIGSVLLCFFPIIYTAIPISYIVIVYAFNPELSSTEIVSLAFALGNKNWFETFLLRIVMSFVAMLGLFLCGIGYFATFAIVLIPMYYVYKHAVGFKEQNDIDSIGLSEEI